VFMSAEVPEGPEGGDKTEVPKAVSELAMGRVDNLETRVSELDTKAIRSVAEKSRAGEKEEMAHSENVDAKRNLEFLKTFVEKNRRLQEFVKNPEVQEASITNDRSVKVGLDKLPLPQKQEFREWLQAQMSNARSAPVDVQKPKAGEKINEEMPKIQSSEQLVEAGQKKEGKKWWQFWKKKLKNGEPETATENVTGSGAAKLPESDKVKDEGTANKENANEIAEERKKAIVDLRWKLIPPLENVSDAEAVCDVLKKNKQEFDGYTAQEVEFFLEGINTVLKDQGKKIEWDVSAKEFRVKGTEQGAKQKEPASSEEAKPNQGETASGQKEEEKHSFAQELVKFLMELFEGIMKGQGLAFGQDGRLRRQGTDPSQPSGETLGGRSGPEGGAERQQIEGLLQTLKAQEKDAKDAYEACKAKIKAVPRKGVENRGEILRELRSEEVVLLDRYRAAKAAVKRVEARLRGAGEDRQKEQYASEYNARQLQRFFGEHGVRGVGVTTLDGGAVRVHVPRTSAQWGIFHDGTVERELMSIQDRRYDGDAEGGEPIVTYSRFTNEDGSETVDFRPYREDVSFLDAKDLEYNVTDKNRLRMLQGRSREERAREAIVARNRAAESRERSASAILGADPRLQQLLGAEKIIYQNAAQRLHEARDYGSSPSSYRRNLLNTPESMYTDFDYQQMGEARLMAANRIDKFVESGQVTAEEANSYLRDNFGLTYDRVQERGPRPRGFWGWVRGGKKEERGEIGKV